MSDFTKEEKQEVADKIYDIRNDVVKIFQHDRQFVLGIEDMETVSKFERLCSRVFLELNPRA